VGILRTDHISNNLLTTITSDGDIFLNLPRSFHGPLLLKIKDGKIRFSEEVQAQITTFSEDKGIRKCFLGEFVAEEYGEEGWAGDEVTAGTKDRSIYIWFDEVEKPKGFFQKVFWDLSGAFIRLRDCIFLHVAVERGFSIFH
jgi:hypothetical protein